MDRRYGKEVEQMEGQMLKNVAYGEEEKRDGEEGEMEESRQNDERVEGNGLQQLWKLVEICESEGREVCAMIDHRKCL